MALDIAKELDKTLHIDSAELPWIEPSRSGHGNAVSARAGEGRFLRLAAARAAECRGRDASPSRQARRQRLYVERARGGTITRFLFRPGVHIFETPGVIPINSSTALEVSEVRVLLAYGEIGVEWVDPDTLELKGPRITEKMLLQHYVDRCDEQGVKPSLLGVTMAKEATSR